MSSDLSRRQILVYTLLISIGIVVFLFQAHAGQFIPYDDAYTMSLIKHHSFADILRITSQDVHPPLYYWGLKGYSLLAGDSLFALRTFSVWGVVGMMFLACLSMRRLFGFTVSWLFILLLILYPATQNLAIDARMYSWTAFFVLASALFAYDAYRCSRRRDLGHWLRLTLLSLCAAYCHNYGLIAVAGIYLILFVSILYRKNWPLMRRCIMSASAVIILYFPWLYQLLGQMDNIAGDYWIKPLTTGDLYLHAYYFYSPKLIEFPFRLFNKTQMMVGVIAVMASQLLVVALVCVRSTKKELLNASLALCVFLFPVLVGVLFSQLVFPILVPRYMLCVFPLLLLMLAFIFSRAIEEGGRMRKIAFFSLLLLAANGVVRHCVNVQDSQMMAEKYENVRSFAQTTNGTSTKFVTFRYFPYSLSLMTEIMPDQRYFIYGHGDKNYLPFEFETFDPRVEYPSEIVFVASEGQNNLRLLQSLVEALKDYYVVSERLHEAGIFFCKMRATQIYKPR